jgi:hypothetical protein
MSPPGPSRTGSHGENSVASAEANARPANISVVFARARHPKVEPDVAVEAQDCTPPTKVCQVLSRRAAVNNAAVAGNPDWNIC